MFDASTLHARLCAFGFLLLGFTLIAAVAFGLLGDFSLASLLAVYPLAFGSGAALILALAVASAPWLLRQARQPHGLLSTVALTGLVFAAGSLLGCVVNALILGAEGGAYDWVLKPLFWLWLYGLPLCVPLGALYWLALRRLRRQSAALEEAPAI